MQLTEATRVLPNLDCGEAEQELSCALPCLGICDAFDGMAGLDAIGCVELIDPVFSHARNDCRRLVATM